jgi:hypothetical protein
MGANRGRRGNRFLIASAAVALVGSVPASRAAVVYSDNFDRASLNGGAYVYTTSVMGGDGAASLVDDRLQLTNDASAATNASGIVHIMTPTSGYAPGFDDVLGENTGSVLTWTMNLRQPSLAPGGMLAGQVGAACILGASSADPTADGVSGYAIVIGNSGTNDSIRLVKFTNGLDALAGTSGSSLVYVVSAASASRPADYYSVRVSYQPSTDTWNLFTRNDGTSGFADPADPSGYSNWGTSTDTTATNVPLTHSGAYWSYNSEANQSAVFDNFALDVSADPSVPEPAGAALAGVAALLLGRRARRVKPGG